MAASFRLRRALRAAALVLAAAPACAAAQERVPTLRMGQTVQGAISADAPALGGARFRVYRLEARPERMYRLMVTSAGTARLQVARQAGGLTEIVVTGPAPADTVRLLFRPQSPGDYLAVVSADSGAADLSVAFTLVADEVGAGAPVPRPLEVDAVVRGELSDRSALMNEGTDQFYDLYTFRALGGQTLAAALYTYGVTAALGRMRAGRFEVLPGEDTASADGVVRIPEDGEYAVRVHAALGESGRYPYAMRLVDLASRPAPRPVELSRRTTAVFDPATAFPRGEGPVDEWSVQATRGQRLTIDVMSDTFDAYVVVGREVGGIWTEITRDDDGGEANDARAVLDVPETGTYLIRAHPFLRSLDAAGEYTLLVRESRAPLAVPSSTPRTRPQTQQVRWREPLAGVLDESDALVADGTPWDAWTFSATAGQRITITLHSSEFDAYLAVGTMDGDTFRELSSNDDYAGGDGRDARIVMVAPDTGEYVIRVNTVAPGERGSYELRVERGP